MVVGWYVLVVAVGVAMCLGVGFLGCEMLDAFLFPLMFIIFITIIVINYTCFVAPPII